MQQIEENDFPQDWIRISDALLNYDNPDLTKRMVVYEVTQGNVFDDVSKEFERCMPDEYKVKSVTVIENFALWYEYKQ